jgi:peptide deformylase
MVQKIVDVKDPKLRQKSKRVAKVDKKTLAIARDLVDTLKVQKDPEGVGLAAPQIGKNVRMFAMVFGRGIRVIVNPKILSLSQGPRKKGKAKKQEVILEGCLSLPNIYGPLKRPQHLKLEFMDLDGKIQTEVFEGFSAQIVQHEVDHLNGTLFFDQLLKDKAPLYKFNSKLDDWEEVELV